MYRIIGGDNRQYGPVTAAGILEWIQSGRASSATMAQREGETEWRSLSSFPEFADAFAGLRPGAGGAGPGGSGATVETAAEVAPDPEALVAEAIRRDPILSIGDALGRGWELLKADFWPIVGVTALMILALSAANSAFIGPLVAGPLLGGLNVYLLRKVRRQRGELADAFLPFRSMRDFVQLLAGYLVYSLLAGLGLLLCVLPGIYLAVAWQFTLYLIMDRRLDFWPAMEVSRKVISRNWWGFFAFAIVAGLLNLAGTLACLVGVFVTMPWTMLALASLYDERLGAEVGGGANGSIPSAGGAGPGPATGGEVAPHGGTTV